jgi:beta-hydroxyacyl-ACP dehydratase FabZ
METIFDIQQIMNYLPHRYPFLLIDRIVEFEKGERIEAIKNVTYNEPFFNGHFPGAPIMPGVLIVEAMAQAGGVLVFASLEKEAHNIIMYFMALDKVRFRKPVIPGDQLLLKIDKINIRMKAAKLKGEAYVNDQKVAEAILMATFGERT